MAKVAESNDRTNPEMVAHLVRTFGQVYSPGDSAVVHDVVIEHLEKGPRVSASDPYEHVAEHFKYVFPAVMRDARVEPVQQRLLDEYAKLPSTPETRLRQHPGDNSVGFAVVLGGAIGVIVAGAIVGYCLGGPDPAPGESVEVRC